MTKRHRRWYSTLLIIKDMDKDKMYKDSKNNNIIIAQINRN